MTFCSLEEAWGGDAISSMYKPHQSNQEQFSNTTPAITSTAAPTNVPKNQEKININYENNQSMSCDMFIHHVRNCKYCSNKLGLYRTPLLDELRGLVNQNKDMVVLVLLGVFILLFFNLVNNVTKN